MSDEFVVCELNECVHFEDVVGDDESEGLGRGEGCTEFGVVGVEAACKR